MARPSWIIIVTSLAVALSCRSNPFGNTKKSIEEFNIYTSDFSAQNDGGAKDALLDVIGGAKVSLNCAFSALTLSEVTNALVNRARAGVQVKVAFDADVKDNDAGSLTLQSSGSFIVVSAPLDTNQSQLLYGNGGSAYMRHNYCLADERYIYISTAPPDDTLMRKTPNIALKIGSPQFGLARDFLRESNMFSQLLFGNGKAKTDFTTKFTALDQVIGAYWGPQEKPLDVLGTELSEAISRVDFYSTAFLTTNSSKTDLDVPQTLLRLESAKGIPLKKYFSSQALFDTSSKAYTLSNPAQYINSNVRVGANFFVIDRGLSSAKTFIYTGALRSQANSSDDSVLIELRGKYVAEIVGAYLDRIGAVSVVASNTGDVSSAGAVVINEINWAGSYSNSSTSDSNDEFLELYNTTASPINISGWRFACTTDGGTTVSSYFQMPSGAVIPASGFFTVASKSTGAFPNATFFTGSLSITNSSRECKLTNGKAAASTYPGEAALTGDIIDTAGDNATAFDNSGNVLGMNDSTNKIRRSMERKQPVTAGTSLGSWQANVNSVAQNTDIDSQFNQKTFGTPGGATSIPVPSVALNRSLYFTASATHPNGIAKLTGVNVAANTNAGSLQTIIVTARSTSDATGINLTLTETGNNTGIFTSAATGTHLNFTTGASAGNQLHVVSGDTVTISYTYSGTTYTATAQWYQQNLMINEIGSNCGGTSANDYIEIHNPNAQTVSLTGMTVYRDSGTSGTACTIGAGNYTSTINLSGTIAGNGYALATGSTYTAGGACPAADFTASSSVSIDDADCIALVLSGAGPATATDDEVIDFVGMGNATNAHEGAAVATDLGGGNNQCISRNPNATDTNGNGADFANEVTVPCSPRGATGSLNVISASTGSGTALQITFNGAPNTVQAQTAGNYCIALASAADCSSPALTVSAPSLSGSTVTLTTSAQTVSTSYRVYVTGVTLAAGGGALLTNSATFTGAAALPNLKINEVGVSSASNDFVEIYNPTGSAISLTGLYLQRDSGCNLGNGITEVLTLSGSVPAGGYYVLANSGHSLSNVNSATLGNIASGYCIILTSNNTAVTAVNNTNVIDFVSITGGATAENASFAPDTGANGAISRMPNGTDTNTNGADFVVRTATPGVLNGTPTYTSNPASSATGVAINANVVFTFSETMNNTVGSVTVSGTISGSQAGLTCAWSMTTVANDTCTINPPADFSNAGETVTVTLSAFISQANSIGPAVTSFNFTTVNTALTPTVTNVVVASTSPNNGTTPYNTGTSTLTITGTNFTGASCPSAVKLNDPATTTASSCTVDSATQITATLPAGIRTNGSTGWDVQVTTPNGTNTTSTVTFKPVAGLLITEVGDNFGGNTNNDYIEIFNPTAQDINLSSYRWLRDGSCALAGGWTQSNVTFGAITSIVSRKYLLISRASNTISGDLTTLTAMANSHCVALTFGGTAPISPTGSNIIDFVSFGTVTDSENASLAPNLPVNGAIRRNGACKTSDTDQNATDFTAVASPAAPNTSASAACP
ncbi:MAG: lamin tail domain-containing protein [Leptospiraceae bacterium]|nr:lamin tail domain-containing protein [Leptospiraceae bacterium]